MARKLRLQLPEHTYHIMSRCIEWRDMMQEEYFKACFVDILNRTKEKYDFKLVAYCIMDNHIHIVIHTTSGGAPIARIVQYIKARFAEVYNKITGRTGPFWNERYKDIIVQFAHDAFHYLLWLLWYIAFNPVRKRRCDSPTKYRYSSIQCYVQEGADVGVPIDHHEYFLQLGDSFSERVRRFLQYEEAYRKRYSIAQWV
ncbi:MAG TPA: transposase [Spirochaetota bacterium]|nr:transposase [Spirochaetota bacterium]HQK08421.1 transposase [Spirochaetota bacterium]